MTTQNKATLTLLFEQGDIPSGTNYADFIDSYVNIAETSAQTIASPLIGTEFIASRVSATNANITGILSAGTFAAGAITGSNASFSGTVSAGNSVFAALGVISNGGLRVAADVSAEAGTVYASAVRSTNGVINGAGVVSAAGTSQGAAAVLTNVVNRGKGIVDGTTTGFTPLANRAGLVQYLYNEGASANLWPPTGGTINGLAANAAFPLAASASYTIIHLTASAYGVHG